MHLWFVNFEYMASQTCALRSIAISNVFVVYLQVTVQRNL